MSTHVPTSLRDLTAKILLWCLVPGLILLSQSASYAGDDPSTHVQKSAQMTVPATGTLGYGPPGLFPGYQGFGKRFHPGYGYGGDALGPGAFGGYPFYGGPGYPQHNPVLRRFSKSIVPFPYFNGNGLRTVYSPSGRLVPNPPVAQIEATLGYSGGYGGYSGAIGYPERKFAPFTTPNDESSPEDDSDTEPAGNERDLDSGVNSLPSPHQSLAATANRSIQSRGNVDLGVERTELPRQRQTSQEKVLNHRRSTLSDRIPFIRRLSKPIPR